MKNKKNRRSSVLVGKWAVNSGTVNQGSNIKKVATSDKGSVLSWFSMARKESVEVEYKPSIYERACRDFWGFYHGEIRKPRC